MEMRVPTARRKAMSGPRTAGRVSAMAAATMTAIAPTTDGTPTELRPTTVGGPARPAARTVVSPENARLSATTELSGITAACILHGRVKGVTPAMPFVR